MGPARDRPAGVLGGGLEEPANLERSLDLALSFLMDEKSDRHVQHRSSTSLSAIW
jgi:hypothetical protein